MPHCGGEWGPRVERSPFRTSGQRPLRRSTPTFCGRQLRPSANEPADQRNQRDWRSIFLG
jgi:hypothetical protein